MRLVDAAEPTFARHETFHPRYGWFRKAYVFSAWDPLVFSRDDAPVVIGVGKNMVRAIRFWGLAAKIIVQDPRSKSRTPPLVPTRLGHALFGELGWDPYMEDPGTLWLLHWLLLAPRCRLPVWWLTFNEFNALEFCDDDLQFAIDIQLEGASGWPTPHPKSVQKDVTALLRTYAPVERSGRVGLDDLLDCPLRELGMITRSQATGRYRFNLGGKPTLPPAIVAYACLDYATRTDSGATTMTLTRLSQEPGSPGKAYKLNEFDLHSALAVAVEDHAGDLALVSPTGATQLAWNNEPKTLAIEVLNRYYETDVEGAAAGPAGDQPLADELLDDIGLGRDPDNVIRRLVTASSRQGPR